MRYSPHFGGGDTEKDDNYSYFLISEALDGNGSLPYPMEPEADGDDELLDVTGLGLTTEQDWSLKLALMMPIGNWDHHAARGVFTTQFDSDRRWPLFTLWADLSNWIEFSADCEGKGFRVKVNVGGTISTHDFGDGKQVWLPDSPLLVAIGFEYTSPSTQTLHIGASLGGDLVQSPSSGISVGWSSETTFDKLKFRGATGGVSNDGEVCEMRAIGGEFDTSNAITTQDMPEAFVDLAFLGGP